MRYLALACDYDGTLASDGHVSERTLAALDRLRATGRRLLLVTGRQLPDLLEIFPHVHLFERIVAENGALVYRPATRDQKVLGDSPPDAFIAALRERGVEVSSGRVIVATSEPYATAVLDTIRDLGLELHVVFNKGSVMVLPSGLNKATGLNAALAELGLSPHNTVGVGDAENDHAFLGLCECSVGVANALPLLKERADLVTCGHNGAGVVELIDRLINTDLTEIDGQLRRHDLLLGVRPDGRDVNLKPYGVNVLLAGPSGSGKSSLATGFLERLAECGYQFAIIDPEGDYETLEGAVPLGNSKREPSLAEVLGVLEKPGQNVVIGLLGIALEHRRSFFEALLPRLQELRARTGRPHWIIVDEAHHLLPASWDPSGLLPQELKGMMLITVQPESVAPAALSFMDAVVAVGDAPVETMRAFTQVLGHGPPAIDPVALAPGEALAWWRRTGEEPFHFRIAPPRAERRRHRRKYAEGDLGPDRSFYFRGPEGKLNLRAQNLMIFIQLAEGVDDDTWLYHLRRGDYSRWFREYIKDEALAAEAARIESLSNVSPRQSRAGIKAEIEQRYTAPA